MKKALVLAIVLVAAASSLSALDYVVGPKVGVADFNYVGDDKPSGDNTFSLSPEVGGFVNLQFTPMIGLQIEAMYAFQTFRLEDGNWLQFGIHALSLPVYARFDFDLGGFGIYALAGAQADILIGDVSQKLEGGEWESYGSVKDNFDNLFLINLAGGAGVSLPLGPGVLDVGAGIKYSLTSLFDDIEIFPWGIDVQAAYGFSL